MENEAQTLKNGMNNLSGGAVLFKKGQPVRAIALLVKGRVEAVSEGVCVVLGSGNFLGVCDVSRGAHSFTYTAKDDAVIYILEVNGLESIENLLKVKPEYRGLLVTSLNFFIVELKKHLEQLKQENHMLYDFMNEKYSLCEDVAKTEGMEYGITAPIEKIKKLIKDEVRLSSCMEYYLECGTLSIDIQKKYFNGSEYIAFFHFKEQCLVVESLVQACEYYGENVYKFFRCLIMDEDSLFQTIGKLALSMAEKDNHNMLIERAVDEIVEKINDTETFLIDRAGMEIHLDRERMEKLYFALLAGGDSSVEEEMEQLDTPGVEYLFNSLEQIMEYAPVHVRVTSEFSEAVEKFIGFPDRFAKIPEVQAVRKQLVAGFFEIYEAVVKKSFEDNDIPLAVRLFLEYGFVSERLLTEDELKTILSLRPKKTELENGCRVYTMRQWLKAVYDGLKDTSKNEFDMDYEETLRQLVKEHKMEKKDIARELADKDKRMSFECQNMFRYADRVVSGNISSFVPILCSDGIFNNIKNSYLTEFSINEAVKKTEDIDYSVFYRDRLASYEKIDVNKATVVDRITPDVILFPEYGRNCSMWQDITGKRHNTKGRFLLPILFEKNIDTEMVRLLAAFRWEKCRTDTGSRWNDFRYPSLTSEYTDYLQFYRKSSELSQERKIKIRSQLQQCNNKHREVFSKDYSDWILREAHGAMKLSSVARNILSTYCPFSNEIYKLVENQTVYSEAAKKHIREVREQKKSVEILMRRFEKDGIDVPDEIQKTMEYLKG